MKWCGYPKKNQNQIRYWTFQFETYWFVQPWFSWPDAKRPFRKVNYKVTWIKLALSLRLTSNRTLSCSQILWWLFWSKYLINYLRFRFWNRVSTPSDNVLLFNFGVTDEVGRYLIIMKYNIMFDCRYYQPLYLQSVAKGTRNWSSKHSSVRFGDFVNFS